MPIPIDYNDIVVMLVAHTDAGTINWRSSQAGVAVDIGDSLFEMWSGTDGETDAGFVSFALKDAKGKTLDTWFVDEGDSDYARMQDLYVKARRLALGVPARLASIREALGKAKTVGGTQEEQDDDLPF